MKTKFIITTTDPDDVGYDDEDSFGGKLVDDVEGKLQ